MGKCFMDGNDAVAMGAVDAGCRFFAGYPITPATGILNRMLDLLPPAGGICLQGEDEIASIGFCLGASMAGMKVMTATSGPGISLYSEQISFAVGSEIPIVIVDVQRLGPSTGSATKGADGDIQFLRWGNSGGLPVIVLCPSDVADCYQLTMQAFNLAESYRCPVFVAANKEISITRESIDIDNITKPPIIDRRQPDKIRRYLPFAIKKGALVPEFLPIGGKQIVRQTSSTHGADGYITTDPASILENQRRLIKKVESSIDQWRFFDFHGEDTGDTLVVTYGVTARAARAAAAECTQKGMRVSVLTLKALWPVLDRVIRAKSKSFSRIVVPEMNMGQYAREIELILQKKVTFIGRMNGSLITPRQIREVIFGV